MSIQFNGRVAIVTGAGGGLGRQHALALAARGAKVLVNDLGGAVDGTGGSVSAAQAVVDEIRAAGGEALANGASVTDFAAVQAMVQQAIDAWGRVDILVNNAGILRDKSFAKMDVADFRTVVEVHLMGAVHCCKAVWPHMVAQQYGRIVMTTSSSGLFGNFGQTNYGAAKLALVGLMQTLAIEGERQGIRVNSLAPTAATRMTEDLFPADMLPAFGPHNVVPAMLVLASEGAPTRTTLCAGAGGFEAAHITLTQGVYIGDGPDAPEQLAARLAEVTDRAGEVVPAAAPCRGPTNCAWRAARPDTASPSNAARRCFASPCCSTVFGFAPCSALECKPVRTGALEGRARLGQEGDFFGRGDPPQDRIAMRVATETLDDGLVAPLEGQRAFQPRLGEQCNRVLVDQRRLAVHVGHVGEGLLRRGQGAVLAGAHELLRQAQRLRVLREGTRCVAPDVAGELVQHDDLGQPPFGRCPPGLQFSNNGRLQRGAEALADGRIEGRVLGKASCVVQFLEPEVQHGGS
jgi:NAD(P)-dependent dehydrogenase (short-subunit alcohol dehydrogenase family)